jgi:hypothetical protein
MAIAPSKLGEFVWHQQRDGADSLVRRLRGSGLVRLDASDDELTAVSRRAQQEHDSLPESSRSYNSPHERVRVFLAPYLSDKGRKWAVPIESLHLPDDPT